MAEQRAKFVMCGEPDVGKTSLIHQLVRGSFDFNRTTIVCSWYVPFTQTKTISVAGETIKAELWDTAGQERYDSLTRMYFRAADGGIIVYDISNRLSFERSARWAQQVRQNAPQASCVLVGNKVDLYKDRTVSFEEGCGLAYTLEIPFVETSAKTGLGVMDAFQAVAAGIIGQQDKWI